MQKENSPQPIHFFLDLEGCGSSADMHSRLKEAFGLPDYYGNNFDALWDCLCELFAAPRPVTVQVQGLWDMDESMGEKAHVLTGLFAELQDNYPHVYFLSALSEKGGEAIE